MAVDRGGSTPGSGEIVLHGGNTNTVVRVGDTVRRTSGPWTATVHSLLRQLEVAGFDAAPRVVGVDSRGREVLSFIDGDTVAYPMPRFVWSDATLVQVGQLLRRYHDLTATMAFPKATWRPYAVVAGPSEVICHCDWGPYNAVFRDGRIVAMIDWDFARPGSRLADIAYAAYTWVPMKSADEYRSQGTPDVEQGRRLRLLCDAYGLDDRAGVVPALATRLRGLTEWVEALASAGAPDLDELLTAFRSASEHVARNAPKLEAALT